MLKDEGTCIKFLHYCDRLLSLFPGKKNTDPAGSPLLLLPPLQPNSLIDVASMKLKLQLFPVDDGTRRALESVRLIEVA